MVDNQHIKPGEYLILFYNKYGAVLKDLTETAKTLEHAKDIGERRQFNVDDISQDETHHLPVAFTVDRRIYNSEETK
jgi:cytochrome c oxidase assembly protein Cox11